MNKPGTSSKHPMLTDYHSRLYNTYVSTYFGHIRDLSSAALERQCGLFRQYFGRLLPQDRDARILEVGCGYGAFLSYLQAEGYRNVEGVDISPEQAEAARRLGLSNVVCADAIAFLQEHPETYDCVVAIDFIDHIPKGQVLDVLKAIYSGLRPAGVLILQAVNAGGPFAGRLRYADFTHEFALTPVSARQVPEAVGFGDVRIFGTDPFIHSFPSLVRVLVWKVIRAVLWVYLAVETGVTRGHIFTQNLIAVARKPTL